MARRECRGDGNMTAATGQRNVELLKEQWFDIPVVYIL
jgi:hypothetical protein